MIPYIKSINVFFLLLFSMERLKVGNSSLCYAIKITFIPEDLGNIRYSNFQFYLNNVKLRSTFKQSTLISI